METKNSYIKKHGRSQLADALLACNWPGDRKIEVIGGLIAPENKCSNLYKALERSEFGKFVVGGHRWRGTEGFWMAVS